MTPPRREARRLDLLDRGVKRCTGCGAWLWRSLCCAWCAARIVRGASS